jgi:hypothetical protein
MAIMNIVLTTGNYPVSGGTSSNPTIITAGEQVTVNLSMQNAANFSGSKGISLVTNTHAGAFSNEGTPSGTFSFSFEAPGASYSGNNLPPLYFFARHNGNVILPLESARTHWQVIAGTNQSHPVVTGVTFANTASSTTEATIATSGGTGQLQTAATTANINNPTLNWSNGNKIDVARGVTNYFWARSLDYSASNTSYASPVAATAPYLAPSAVSAANATTNTAGAWISALTVADNSFTTMYSLANSLSPTGATFYYRDSTFPFLGNFRILGNSTDATFNIHEYNGSQNSPPPGSNRTYYIWGKRFTGSGGDSQWHPTTASFTVTADSPVIAAECTNPSGFWYDTDSSFNPHTTRASFRYLNPYRVYMIARQDSGGNWEKARNGWAGKSAETSYTFQDPLSVIDTQRTYRLYSNTSATLTGATQELTFTRTEKSPQITEPLSITIGMNDDSYTVALEDTIAGFTYYIKDSTDSGAGSVDGVVATGTSTSIPVTGASFMPGEEDGSATTVYVWVKAPLNLMNTTSQPSGDSISIVRSSGSGQTGEDPEVTAGSYGMIVRDASNNLLVDTTSRFGRIVKSGRVVLPVSLQGKYGVEGWIPGSHQLTGTPINTDEKYSEWVSVPGMTNDPLTWHVIVTTITSDGSYGFGHNWHEVYMEDDRFRVLNLSLFEIPGYSFSETGSVSAKYDYFVIRTRG